MINTNVAFHSIISSIQNFVLYETKSKYYLVGSNDRQTRFRVLVIDRTTPPHELRIHEDSIEYGARDIAKLVRTAWGCQHNQRPISAYGILGFVRFHEGYYLLLITKRARCAFIGQHLVYTVTGTAMVPVQQTDTTASSSSGGGGGSVNSGSSSGASGTSGGSRPRHPLEQRYVKMFQNIDLTRYFYFSYSYDLTRTLQYNQTAPRFCGGADVDVEHDEPLPDWQTVGATGDAERQQYAFRSCSRQRFVWNAFLLKPMAGVVQRDWTIEVVHGFVSQSNVSIFGRPVYVCLLARRSTRYAGTRFLKRGANFAGDVANEVETEQIVHDGPRASSFVQMRGSMPGHWSQDIGKMPKPPIGLDLSDPFAQTAGRHFERLLRHFGAPVIVLNLVKMRERRRHESILTEELVQSVRYLNQFLAPAQRIRYVHFDMARKSRGGGNVMAKLAGIAGRIVQRTGFYFEDAVAEQRSVQTGLVRVNCVDCLDRTNTAQFAIGKCALAHQLSRLGFLRPPAMLEFDSDCVTMLESLYEDHGDTLALQYGGSQLVHRIKTYRNTAGWTSQGNDIMQTWSRYYSNKFSDTEKQHSINLFLGCFVPYEAAKERDYVPIWELPTDYYLHNPPITRALRPAAPWRPITQWCDPFVLRHLPFSTSDATKMVKQLFHVASPDIEAIDYYTNYHFPYRWTPFEEHIALQIAHRARSFMPTYRTNFSPFQPGRRRERRTAANPSMTGQSSTGSTASATSASSSEESSEDEAAAEEADAAEDGDIIDDDDARWTAAGDALGLGWDSLGGPAIAVGRAAEELLVSQSRYVSFGAALPSMLEVYGCSIGEPGAVDLMRYKRYVQMGRAGQQSRQRRNSTVAAAAPGPGEMTAATTIDLRPMDDYGDDCWEHVREPRVDAAAMSVYEAYVSWPETAGATLCGVRSAGDAKLLRDYAAMGGEAEVV